MRRRRMKKKSCSIEYITKLKFVSLELLTTSTWLTWQEVILSMCSLLIPETDWIPFLLAAAVVFLV